MNYNFSDIFPYYDRCDHIHHNYYYKTAKYFITHHDNIIYNALPWTLLDVYTCSIFARLVYIPLGNALYIYTSYIYRFPMPYTQEISQSWTLLRGVGILKLNE